MTELIDQKEALEEAATEAQCEEAATDSKRNMPGKKALIGGIAIGLILAAAIAALCLAIAPGTDPDEAQEAATPPAQTETAETGDNEGEEEGTTPKAQAEMQTADADADACEHVWAEVYGLEHHDTVTHEVYHEPEYASETSYHTVCNECRQTIDGKAAEHIEKTGHSGYSTNVPITSEVLVTQGWTETVTDEEARDELVVTGEKCSLCGQERDAQGEESQG